MYTFIRRLFKLTLIVGSGLAILTGVFFWAGIWGIYSVPPSDENPDGATWIVSRDDREPFFNASDRPVPPPPAVDPSPRPPTPGIVGVEIRKKPVKPIDQRIVVRLPFIKYAHEQAVTDTDAERGKR